MRPRVWYLILCHRICSPIGTPWVDSDILNHDTHFIWTARHVWNSHNSWNIWHWNTAWKVLVFGVILVLIFLHSDWIWRNTGEKMRTRITPNKDTFYTVKCSQCSNTEFEIKYMIAKTKYVAELKIWVWTVTNRIFANLFHVSYVKEICFTQLAQTNVFVTVIIPEWCMASQIFSEKYYIDEKRFTKNVFYLLWTTE